MLNLTLLMPQEKDLDPMKDEDFFLWQAESAVLPDMPEPGEADAQEIAIYPEGSELLRLLFNAGEPDLQERVAGYCNSFYAMYGSEGVRAFAAAILDPPATLWDPATAPREPLNPPLKGERVYRGEDTPKRHRLLQAYKKQKKVLDAFIVRAEKRIQAKALEVVKARLKKLNQQLVTERIRYKMPPQGSMIVAPELEANLNGLAQAMWEIATLKRELEYFDAQYVMAQHTPGTGYYIPSPEEFRKRTEPVEKDQARVRETLVARLVEHCKRYPVLHRLWKHPALFDVADTWVNALPKDKSSKVTYNTRLLDTIDETLNGVQAAMGLMETELNEAPEVVWRYSPVINEALKSLHLGRGDMAWMVAQERLASFKGQMGPFAKLSLGIGIVEDLAAMAAATPPIAALLAAASLTSALGDVIESAVEEGKKDRAFEACLNPADSFAAEQGNYIGAVVGALFFFLQLRGAVKSGRAW
ncbi:hypothetical protein SAMN05216350_11924 [Polaromonas sp. YR568]|uniref:hypothetical protein n=1 Tax=Polaromonas sp. YR568 TaxID=1855301 RepID=UPI0008E27751|nr:hypothetical protein [Polaromonas sp. YR568]SFV04207.1 hypothetical protein SAMN05216350_11924 [Polaromonas sp. YR568]